MIALLKGNFLYLTPAKLIVEIGGLGYEVQISLQTYEPIKNLTEGSLFIYHHITEQSQSLFGFYTQKEKEIFILLMTVNGIGANTARLILSGMQIDELFKAISLGNLLQLEKIKGIGKKTAERIIIELKDKIIKISSTNFEEGLSPEKNIKHDAIQALMTLGIAKIIAEKSVETSLLNATEDLNLESLIKLALKNC
ncbi:MAG: Holliday junction branch migration protein RuvA [Alphaproteobacteria bacterium]|nr:Holliday junction branch migration protein RuvA [Alphaproteobacteria bacterium]